MTVDPVAIITAIGIAVGSLTGSLEGYGVQVGAVIRPGEPVVIGVDPITIWDTPALADVGLGGLTLGSTTLIVPTVWYVQRDLDQYVPLGYDPNYIRPRAIEYHQRKHRGLLAYEFGHREFWTRFGVRYPVRMLERPCDYDPAFWGFSCYGWDPNEPSSVPRGAYTRTEGPGMHYALMFRLGSGP